MKIEINTREHFQVAPIQQVDFSIDSEYFSGKTQVVTYGLEELMGTKLRALYQRRKGRDLFDAWYVFSKGLVDIESVVRIFHEYNKYNDQKITKKNFIQNMKDKKHNVDFKQDISALLPPNTDYNFDTAFDFVMKKVLPLI
ncbi:MAG: nucleotidyl transferase AbiEii/AbiGii toxin family protein [Bacteroidota bacterium]